MTRPLDSFDEQSWIEAARYDPVAFAPVYERYAVEVYRFCYRRTAEADLANDLTAQIFVRALERLEQYSPRPGASFRSWLFAIARNIVADHWRRHRPMPLSGARERTLPDGDPGPEQIAIHRLEIDELRQVLELLPRRQRDIVELRLAGLTTAEIANAMDTSSAAVKSAQTRAYSRIREVMKSRAGDVQ